MQAEMQIAQMFGTVDVVGIAAVMVAAFALFATLWQSYVTRRHNRLSVAPYLRFDVYWTHTDIKEAGIYLANKGVGPAIIRSFSVSLDGEPSRYTSSPGPCLSTSEYVIL